MTWRKRTIMEMANETLERMEPDAFCREPYWSASDDELEAFAALVREDEAEKYKWDVHSCGPTCERYACVATREAVKAEREACAKLCENLPMQQEYDVRDQCSNAIRARGEQA